MKNRRMQDRRNGNDRRQGRLDSLFAWAVIKNVFIDLRQNSRRAQQERRRLYLTA